MIKNISQNAVQLTPFVVTKPWSILNTHAQDLILIEDGKEDAVPPEVFVALEYVDYYDGSGLPFVNRECNIALEEQTASFVNFDEGERIEGMFYPTEVTSSVGHYKRLVYNQIKNMFYNDYKDVTKMWGMEHIDFPLSNFKKHLADKFKLFTIPQSKFGEKILPGSVQFIDNTLDDDYIIVDDKNGNLIGGYNLFSKYQETRKIVNNIVDGYSGYCEPTSYGDTYGYAAGESASCQPW